MKRLLFMTDHCPANANRWLSEGFEQAGIEVIRGGRSNFTHWNVNWESVPRIDIPTSQDRFELLNLGDLARQARADAVLVWDPVEVDYHRPLDLPCPLVAYVSEGWPHDFAKNEALCPDLRYTQMIYGVKAHPDNAFERGWKYLPGACDPFRHPLPDFEPARRSADVCMLGGTYDWRIALADELRASGLTALTGQRNIAGYALAGQNALTFVCHTNTQAYVEWRVFEAMSMGAIALIDRDEHTDHLLSLLGFEDGKHFLSIKLTSAGYPDTQSVAGRVVQLRAEPELADRIRRSAATLVRQRHTYFHRACEILRDLGIKTEAMP